MSEGGKRGRDGSDGEAAAKRRRGGGGSAGKRASEEPAPAAKRQRSGSPADARAALPAGGIRRSPCQPMSPARRVARQGALQRWFEPARQEEEARGRIERQNREWAASGGAHELVKRGDLDSLRGLVQRDPETLRVRDGAGASLLHAALLLNGEPQQRIAEWLMGEHGATLLPMMYTTDVFFGETALHFPIVHADREMALRVVRACPQLLRSRARGAFFVEPKGGPPTGGGCYFGEYPILFAVCTSQYELVTEFLKAGEQLLDWDQSDHLSVRDSDGNTCLHLCVHHNLPEMFTFLLGLCCKLKPDFYSADLQSGSTNGIVNKSGYTPMTLAALLGHREIFEKLIDEETETVWTYGPVYSDKLALAQVDRPYSTDPAMQGVLQLLVDNDHGRLLMLPMITALLEHKWNRFARPHFRNRCALYTCNLLLFSWASVIEDRATTEYAVVRSAVILGALWKLQREGYEMVKSGLKSYLFGGGPQLWENVLSLSYCALIGLSTSTSNTVHRGTMAVSALVLWTYGLWLLLGFRTTGPFVVMVWKMLWGDVMCFLAIFSCFLFGFAQMTYNLFNDRGITAFANQLKRSFTAILGELPIEMPDNEVLGRDGNTFIYYSYFTVLACYVILASVLLINLLIAMMSDTYQKIKSDANEVWLLQWTRLIFSIESEVTDGVAPDKERYWVEIPTPGGTRRFFVRPFVEAASVREYYQRGPSRPPSLSRVSSQ